MDTCLLNAAFVLPDASCADATAVRRAVGSAFRTAASVDQKQDTGRVLVLRGRDSEALGFLASQPIVVVHTYVLHAHSLVIPSNFTPVEYARVLGESALQMLEWSCKGALGAVGIQSAPNETEVLLGCEDRRTGWHVPFSALLEFPTVTRSTLPRLALSALAATPADFLSEAFAQSRARRLALSLQEGRTNVSKTRL